MGLFHVCFGESDEPKGQKDLNLTEETIRSTIKLLNVYVFL